MLTFKVKVLLLLVCFIALGDQVVNAQRQGGGSVVGYIDTAVLQNQLRFRFDAAYDNPSPDRAEFFYPKCGCFRLAGIDPKAPGPPQVETSVDYQDYTLYNETLLTSNISGFVELPIRALNPEVNANVSGIGDMNAGVKAALYYDDSQYLTLQFRTFIPTGKGERGLGTEHVSLEPGLLYNVALCRRTILEAEIRDIIPIAGTEGWVGNVLRYGVGVGHTVADTGQIRLTPVVEFVSWSVLDGQVFTPSAGIQDAETTIVNMKAGIRVGFGRRTQAVASSPQSLYVGYGRPLTGTKWYDDVLRIELRHSF